MKTSGWFVVLTSLPLLFLSACEWSHSADHPTVILTVEDNGRTVGLPLHANLEVVLKGNPSTGYRWQTIAINPAILQYQSTEYNPDSTDIGASGTYLFHYQATALGSSPLQLHYSDTNGLNTTLSFTVTVNVTAQ
ncbi:MAG: hypothetical protein EPN23_05695 [Verrucomicrobia bacterium]|nr:MAG: hypothetical protein EPN23_05695 [Verrucomicrobiota bacterium]